MASEPINIPIKTTYDDEGAKDAIADAEKLEALEPVVQVDVDATEAKDGIEQIHRPLDELIAKNPWIAEVQADIGDAKTDLETVQQDLKNTGGAADEAGGGIQRMGGAADQSGSVLANMVGNSTQDVAALGGVAGTAGMALGQLGEYATEGGISLKNLAKIAGPMAGLTVATLALSQGSKQAAKAAKELGEQIDNLSTVSDEAAIASMTQMFVNQFVAGKSLAGVWDQIAEQNIEGARRLRDLMLQQGLSEEQTRGLTDAIQKQDKATAQAAATSDKYGDSLKDSTDSASKLGETILESTEIGKQAAGELGTALVEQATKGKEAVDMSIEAQREFNRTVKSSDWGKTQIDGAVAGMSEFTDAHFALINIAAEGEAAIDGFTEAVKQNGLTFDLNTDKGRANQSALEDLARTLDTQLAGAYTAADGNQTEFTDNAEKLATDTLTRLQKEMKLSDEDTAALGAQLGLLPEDIETRYELTGNAIALEQLGLLQGAIDNLPKDVQTKITQKILVGDYVGAVAEVQTYMTNHPVTIDAQIEVGAAAIAAARAGVIKGMSGITVGVTGHSATAGATTVNVNLPRGARHGDIARAMNLSTRRNGRRYGSVHYARR